MKIALVSALVLIVVSVVSVGWLAVRGAGAAASLALEWARPAVAETLAALPAELAPADLEARLDRALAAIRDGRVDGSAMRETLAWLPTALLDGELDAGEIAVLGAKLDRLLGGAAPAAPPADASG